jgi:hypothetical protein
MATTAAPQLRRSKRKQAEQDANQIPKHPNHDAPVPRKRARKDTASATEASSIQSRQSNLPLPPFLALPRELRDEIYRHVLEQDRSSKLKSGSSNIITRCGLIGVNAQISEEFLDAVLFHAPVITTTVRNHNFAHVVTFLNRLSHAQLKRLSKPGADADGDARSKRKIGIILSYSAGAKNSRAHLNRWLDRFDNPDKRGQEIEFVYDNDGTYHNGGYKQRPRARATANQRWNDEAGKIARASGRKRYGMLFTRPDWHD